MLEYIESLAKPIRATRESLLRDGKTYRSRFVAFTNGYLAALRDMKDAIELPEKNRQLEEAMRNFK
ncbi:hypothetical protein LCGC14_2438640 [marine sediment metagenome]|uniref:Uncharacterized protein n=1 Tax=marine sediment metagenome TaxID=412755 RepID=A0A0F9C732_9ZZZZ